MFHSRLIIPTFDWLWYMIIITPSRFIISSVRKCSSTPISDDNNCGMVPMTPPKQLTWGNKPKIRQSFHRWWHWSEPNQTLSLSASIFQAFTWTFSLSPTLGEAQSHQQAATEAALCNKATLCNKAGWELHSLGLLDFKIWWNPSYYCFGCAKAMSWNDKFWCFSVQTNG